MSGSRESDDRKVQNMKKLLAKDQTLRKEIADLFVTLNELQDPAMAVKLLADHIAILVEMLNEFKAQQK